MDGPEPGSGSHVCIDFPAVFGTSDRQASHRPSSLYVTDITSSEWCQVQTAFNLQLTRVRTEAMRLGSKRHLQLEEEVHGHLDIEVASAEDALAVRLLNTAFGLRNLLDTGITRELPVRAKASSSTAPVMQLAAPLWLSGHRRSTASASAIGWHSWRSFLIPPPPPSPSRSFTASGSRAS
jgi:hypothetical protein